MLLVLALARIPAQPGGQSAVSLSRPGQEDLTFWVNHNGLEQFDVEGEVGFGDMARILMRRRANAAAFRALRDRFTFKLREPAALTTDDVFQATIGPSGLGWKHKPQSYRAAAGRILNVPLVVENPTGRAVAVSARFSAANAQSSFAPVEAPARSSGAFFLKVTAPGPGRMDGVISVRAGESEISAPVRVDAAGLGKLRVRLVDENGKPTAARVYLTASDGLAYAPTGAISRIAAMSAEYYFHAQDSFELDLPAGSVRIEAARGTEYRLASIEAMVKAGEPAEATVRLSRWTHPAALGWYSSDAHIHANYTASHHQVITPEDVRLQTLAEDLNNANLMVANSGGAFIHDEQFFEGKLHRLSLPDYILYWNEEMRNSGIYGHMSFFNLKSLVHPIYTGFRDTPHWEDYPPNYATAKAAQEQGGAVTYVHPGYGANLDQASARELPVDLALGQVDAIDVLSNNPEPVGMEIWYRLLNCGFRLAISAGSDSFTNVADHYTPGAHRVYVQPGGPMRYGEWITNYKRGRSFATNGPVIYLTVDGKQPGDEIVFPAGPPRRVRVKADIRTYVPVDKVEVVVNGKVVIEKSAGGKSEIVIDEELPVGKSCWIAARATGPWHRLVLNDSEVFAHTSPVYVRIGAGAIASAEDLWFYIDWIERLIARVNERGRFATPERKQEVIALFQRALEVYRERERNVSAP